MTGASIRSNPFWQWSSIHKWFIMTSPGYLLILIWLHWCYNIGDTVILTVIKQVKLSGTRYTNSATWNAMVQIVIVSFIECWWFTVHLQFAEHWDEFSMEPVFSFDELSSFFDKRTVLSLSSYFLPVPTVKEANGRLRMVDPVSLRVLLRKQVRMAILKSGFRKAYISGFTSELVAMVKKETMDRASGMMSYLFIMSAVVM